MRDPLLAFVDSLASRFPFRELFKSSLRLPCEDADLYSGVGVNPQHASSTIKSGIICGFRSQKSR